MKWKKYSKLMLKSIKKEYHFVKLFVKMFVCFPKKTHTTVFWISRSLEVNKPVTEELEMFNCSPLYIIQSIRIVHSIIRK